jgi:hypothetical protein
MKRELGYAVTVAGIGAGLVLFAASRKWAEIGPEPFAAQERTGRELMPWLPALALAALAGAGAILATRGALRTVVGFALMLAGFGMAGSSLYAVVEGAPIWSPAAAALGGLLVVDAGVLALLRGTSWPGLGARYHRTAAADAPVNGARTAATMWDALDRGEDPTTQ